MSLSSEFPSPDSSRRFASVSSLVTFFVPVETLFSSGTLRRRWKKQKRRLKNKERSSQFLCLLAANSSRQRLERGEGQRKHLFMECAQR